MFKRVLKWLLIPVLILGAGVYVTAHGAEYMNFSCKGVGTNQGEEVQEEFFLRIEKYRWVIFWADDDGMAWLEEQRGIQHLFPYVDLSGPNWNFAMSREEFMTAPFGRFSTISNKAMFGIHSGRVLEGKCVPTAELSDAQNLAGEQSAKQG